MKFDGFRSNLDEIVSGFRCQGRSFAARRFSAPESRFQVRLRGKARFGPFWVDFDGWCEGFAPLTEFTLESIRFSRYCEQNKFIQRSFVFLCRTEPQHGSDPGRNRVGSPVLSRKITEVWNFVQRSWIWNLSLKIKVHLRSKLALKSSRIWGQGEFESLLDSSKFY